MAGFGRSPFGRGPFGKSDLGQDLVVELFPDEYMDESLRLDANETLKDNDKDPLLALLRTIGYMVNNRRAEVDSMVTLTDYEKMPLEIARLWGDMLGLGIDKNDPEFLQRSLLGNASQWLQIKSSKQGYSVRGLASGFVVSVENFWRLDLAYEPLIPFRFRYYLKPKNADASAQLIFHTDSPPGTHAGTPTSEDATYAKSAYVRIVFEVKEPRKDLVDYNTLLDLIIDKIKDVVGIHHEVQAPQFLIRLNAAASITVGIRIDEEGTHQANECPSFDITAADVQPLDSCYDSVGITVGQGIGLSAGPTMSVGITIQQATIDQIDMDVAVTTSADFESAEEELSASVSVPVTIGESESIVVEVPSSFSVGMVSESESEMSVTSTLTSEFLSSELMSAPVSGLVTVSDGQSGSMDVNVIMTSSSLVDEESVLPVPVVSSITITPENEEFETIEVSASVGVEIVVGDQIVIPVSVGASTTITPVDAEMFIPVNPGVTVTIENQDSEIINASFSLSADISVSEENIIPAPMSGTVGIQYIDAEMFIPVNPGVTVTIENQDSEIVNASLSLSADILASEEDVIPASLSGSVIVSSIDGEATVSVNPGATVSVENQSEETIQVNSSISVELVVPPEVIIPVAVPMSADMSVESESSYSAGSSISVSEGIEDGSGFEVSALASVTVLASSEGSMSATLTLSALEDSYDESGSLDVPASVSVNITLSDEIVIPVSFGGSVSLSQIDSLANADAAASISVTISDEDSVLIDVPVSVSVSGEFSEGSGLESSFGGNVSMSRVDALMNADASTSVSVTISDQSSDSIEVSASTSADINSGEGSDLEVSFGGNVSMSRVDALMNADASTSVSVTISDQSSDSIEVSALATSLIEEIDEATNINCSVSGYAEFLYTPSFDVFVNGSVSVSGVSEEWSFGAGGVSIGYSAYEFVSGNSGLLVDVFGSFDYVPADEYPLDSHGVVEMTITSGT